MKRNNIMKEIRKDLREEYEDIVGPLVRKGKREFYEKCPGVPPLMLAAVFDTSTNTNSAIEKCLYNIRRLGKNPKLAQMIGVGHQEEYGSLDIYGINILELLGLLNKNKGLTKKAHNLYKSLKGRRLNYP